MNLSEHFTLEELTHTDHRVFDNTPNEAELENLKYTDPDTWREKLSNLEAESKKSFDSKVADNLKNLSELERRQLVLEDFIASMISCHSLS